MKQGIFHSAALCALIGAAACGMVFWRLPPRPQSGPPPTPTPAPLPPPERMGGTLHDDVTFETD